MSRLASAHLKPADFCLAIGIIAVWGANAAIGKLAVPQIPVFAFLATRFAITGLLLLPFVSWKKEHVYAAFRIAILLNVFHYGLIYSAMPYLDASALALIQQTQVPAAILLGWFFFKEPISLKLGIGITLGFIGLLILKTVETITPLGFFLAVAGGIAWAFSNIEMKRTTSLPLITFMGLTTLFSVPFLAAASFFYQEPVMEKLQTANFYQAGFAMIYQIFLGGTAFMSWKHLMTKYDVGKLVPLTLLQPLFGIAAGMLIFSEVLTGKMIVGGLLIIAGVALIIFNRKMKPQTD